MNDLRIVNFQGDELTVIKMHDDGKIYVNVKSVCRGLGMDENRVKAQRTKITVDPVLMQGKRIITIPTNGGLQEALCLDIEYLPLWVAKINAYILPEDVQNKVIEYQLHAKEVLSKVFVHNQAVVPQNSVLAMNMDMLNPETQALVMLVNSIAQTQLEQKKQAAEISSVKRVIEDIRDVYAIQGSDTSWKEKTNIIINSICRNLGDYKTPRTQIYDKLNERAKCNIRLRVENMKKRALAAGASASSVNAINKLDAIAADDRLKEIYIQIVKEFAICNGYSREDLANI